MTSLRRYTTHAEVEATSSAEEVPIPITHQVGFSFKKTTSLCGSLPALPDKKYRLKHEGNPLQGLG